MAITSATESSPGAAGGTTFVAVSGNGWWAERVEDTAAIAAALAEVGPRLKRARAQRQVTLTQLAAATGVSKSTLSRLESGQRRPSLELLLHIAAAHQTPLDELVGAAEGGHPLVRCTPRRPIHRT